MLEYSDKTYSPANKLEILEDIYLKTLEAIPNAILITNDISKVVVFNKEAELLFGYHRSEVIGEPIAMLIAESDRVMHEKFRSKYIEQPHMIFNYSLNGLHRSGKIMPVEIRASPMIIAKAGIYVLSMVQMKVTNE
jgi:PAS domain S-box-containing protein